MRKRKGSRRLARRYGRMGRGNQAFLRDTFEDTVSAFRRSWGDTQKSNAKHIVRAVGAHPWLMDHIPYGVWEQARVIASL